ncbi:uncharacterized protein An14g05710 [Aspergillus niger]|uniref:Contig An14c0180, genomic contig n=2 Tax=Aspergillus niger TaxID=5061 RepID=A2R3W4_ASPNC|nr:uncharacterized protein An14g05710 [Aspergillus niger]CAK42132.1 unnamed protein product [Aspergillus niger]
MARYDFYMMSAMFLGSWHTGSWPRQCEHLGAAGKIKRKRAGPCNIRDINQPKIKGMRVSTILRFWQPVAIYAIKEFSKNPMLCCCVLADVMGRGKTWTLTGYLVDHATYEPDKPTLIICPPHLVWQWASEIKKFTSKLKILVYFGDAREEPPVPVQALKTLSSRISDRLHLTQGDIILDTAWWS